MKRREFVGSMMLAAGATACSKQSVEFDTDVIRPFETFKWNLVTSWPPRLPGLGLGAENFAERIGKASNGRLKIKVYAGGELVPALEVFDAVRHGTAQMGHDPSYYHSGKVPAAQYFTAIPFGLNANEMNAWLYYGGGLELWKEYYAQFNLIPFPCGQTGVQMGGWFNKEINSVDDLAGLKMRIPGLGGEVMQRAGVTQVTIPASDIFTSLKTGAIDAAEWVGPYNDVSLGLQNAARYYFYPGWHEPGPTIEMIINKDAWETLPDDLKALIELACQAINLDMQSEYNYGNAMKLQQLESDPNIEVRPFPDDVLALLYKLSVEVINELSAKDEWSARIQKSFFDFMKMSVRNQQISEQAFLNVRSNFL